MIDDRAVSTALNYVLSLSIAALLVTGLLLTGSTFVDGSRETVARNELAVIGEHVAADVERVDRLVVAGDGATNASLTQEFPRTVTGSTYDVTLDPTAEQPLEVSAVDPDVTIPVSLSNETRLGESSAGGGALQVRYDAGSDRLVIGNA